MILYEPRFRTSPVVYKGHPSAWIGLETIIADIKVRFNLGSSAALEFGVEYGFSTSALANFFEKVIGVDTFRGDVHSTQKEDHMDVTVANLANWPNIQLVRSDFESYILSDTTYYDLIHVDIVHLFGSTFACGDWAIQHADCVIFHDTISHRQVYNAVEALATIHRCCFYNFPFHHGLGILTRKHE